MEARAKDHETQASSDFGQDALMHAMKATDLYLEAAGKAKTKEEKSRLMRKCNEVLRLAERLKKRLAEHPDPPGPRSTRKLTTEEKIIILRSSRIHGKEFPPWKQPPSSEAFAKDSGGGVYVDESVYTFSPTQQGLFAGWKRPVELVTGPDDNLGPEEVADAMMRASTDSDLVQDTVTDCSVVASLSAAMKYLYPNEQTLLRALIYPFDHNKFRPAVSENGKYIFRMHFNGCWRMVTIDDRLPATSPRSRTLFVADRRNKRLIWPALMEKAYLKVRGGYDFPGSNSGLDLYVLTGWIPEQRLVYQDDFHSDETWELMKRAFEKGNVIATLGTRPLSAKEERDTGLVSAHDYAVMDLKEESGERLLLVKNPWRNSVVWKGVSSVNPADDEMPGMGWITFGDVSAHFDSLYLNWNPEMFTCRQDHHFAWDMPPPTAAAAFSHNPQYTVHAPDSRQFWVLVCRHWQDGELDLLRNGSSRSYHQQALYDPATSTTSNSPPPGFMGLAAYTTSPAGTRVLLRDRSPVYDTELRDSPHVLLRVDKPVPNTDYTLVLYQSELSLPKYSFTMTFFSSSPLTVSRSAPTHAHTQSLSGSWTRRTAGGNIASPRYSSNPSWSIAVPRPTSLSLLLTTDNHKLPIHICVVYRPSSTSEPAVSRPSRRDILMSSGEYRNGATHVQSHASSPVQPGNYIVTVSTYDADQFANFVLQVDSYVPLTVTPLATPNAGRLRRETPPLQLDRAPAEGEQATIHRIPVYLSRLARLSLVARSKYSLASSDSSAMRVSLELGCHTGPMRTVLAASPQQEGEFGDANLGLRTQEVDVEPERARKMGGLWIVVESVGGGRQGTEDSVQGRAVVVEVLSDNVVTIGGWVDGGTPW